jgi:hypothetical protein
MTWQYFVAMFLGAIFGNILWDVILYAYERRQKLKLLRDKD